MSGITEISKITLSDFRPKRIGGEGAEVHKLLLGYLVGRGTGIVEATSADKEETFKGMRGTFEARITDAKLRDGDGNPVVIDVLRSGKAFLSSPFGDMFIEELSDKVDDKTGEIVGRGAVSIEFAYAVYVQRAGNPNGYSWALEPLMEMQAEQDPLNKLKGLLPPSVAGLKQIAAPEKGRK